MATTTSKRQLSYPTEKIRNELVESLKLLSCSVDPAATELGKIDQAASHLLNSELDANSFVQIVQELGDDFVAKFTMPRIAACLPSPEIRQVSYSI